MDREPCSDHHPYLLIQRRLRDWFRKTYLIVCRDCGMEVGPYRSASRAREIADLIRVSGDSYFQ